MHPAVLCAGYILVTLLGLRLTVWHVRSGAFGVIQPLRQLLLGIGNDVFVCLAAVLVLFLLVPRSAGRPRKFRQWIVFLVMIAGILLTLANTIHVAWMGANLAPGQFRYLLDLPVLMDSVVSDLVHVHGLVALGGFFAVMAWLTVAYRLVAAAYNDLAAVSFGARGRTVLILVVAAAGLRSALLHNRLILHEPLETNIMTYLPWRLRLDQNHAIIQPQSGLASFSRLSAARQPAGPGTPELPPGTNILIIMLESFSAYYTDANPVITPNLNSLADTPGWVSLPRHFSNTYRTVGAQFSTLCSRFDPLSFYVIRDYPHSRVSCLPRLLRDTHGYRTLAVSGAQDGFDNVEEWYAGNAFDQVIAASGFPDTGIHRSTYGVHDEHLFPRILQELDVIARPFFAYALTVTTHHPYAIPPEFLAAHPEISGWQPLEQAYYYTDHHLGQFLREAARRPWFDNTLVIIAGDHAPWGFNPGVTDEVFAKHLRRFMVSGLMRHPLLQGLKVQRMTSHLDIAPTVLSLLRQPVPPSFQGASVFGSALTHHLGSQDNQRDSYYQIYNEQTVIRMMADSSACQAFDASAPGARNCSGEERDTARMFRETFFDTVQWEITRGQSSGTGSR